MCVCVCDIERDRETVCFFPSFYRMLKFVPDRHQANLNVAASLPSLSFHIDEDKVRVY